MNPRTPEERRREVLSRGIPDEPEMRRLLAAGPEQMTLRESALYIAGYVAGFAAAEDDDR